MLQHPLKADSKREAGQLKALLERNLDLLQQEALKAPAKVNLPLFLLSSGQVDELPKAEKPQTIGKFLAAYQHVRSPSKEGNTRYTEDIHIAHLKRLLGDHLLLADLTTAALQDYVNRRLDEKNRQGETISHVTVKKELGSLSSIWNSWGIRQGLVSSPLSLKNLDYGKKREQHPFETWEQIARKTDDPESELWDSLFLAVPQIEELLSHVKKYRAPWVYPMFAFVAYTGARRSEMMRARVGDLDYERDEVTIREKKKDRTVRETYRHVPMVPQLKAALQTWLKVHPGGELLFSKKPNVPLSAQLASHYFRWAVDGSRWEVVHGWHTLRHSLVSNLICRGVPERVVMGIVGHLNPATTRRYAHLLPSTVQDAMQLVFGNGQLAVAESQ